MRKKTRSFKPKDTHTSKSYQYKDRSKKPGMKKTYGGR